MATHSSILAQKTPWAEEPGRLQSIGHKSWTRLSPIFLSIKHKYTYDIVRETTFSMITVYIDKKYCLHENTGKRHRGKK